jgi:hypothetical protein
MFYDEIRNLERMGVHVGTMVPASCKIVPKVAEIKKEDLLPIRGMCTVPDSERYVGAPGILKKGKRI